MRADQGQSLQETLASGLAGRRPLLLIDNAEHLLPGLATAIAGLRDAVPTATLLVTSRERLRIDGERVYPVSGMEEREGIELFRERARALGTSIEDSPAVTRLCERLDNLPLALELAAARTALFSPEQLLARLDERLDLLKGGRDTDPRQATLRATIAWSHDLLDEQEQRLFRRLSVFVGGCTYEAAEAVAGAEPDALQSLLDKSLVRRMDSTDVPRYWMLETVREYALEQLVACEELDELERRHCEFFEALVHSADAAIMRPEQRASLAALDADAANWRAALARLEALEDPARAASMAVGLATYWWFRGGAHEGLPVLERLLGRVCESALRARCLRMAAELAYQIDRRDFEKECIDESLGLFVELGDDDGMALSYANYVWWAAAVGDDAAATEWAGHATDAARRVGTAWIRAYVALSVAQPAANQGDILEARRRTQEALRFARESGNPRLTVVALGAQGWLETLDERYEAAREASIEALTLGDPEDRELVSTLEGNLALVETLVGHREAAAAHCRACLAAVPVGSRRPIGEALLGLAACVAASRPDAAVRLWSAGVALHESCGAPLGPVLERIQETMLSPLRSLLEPERFGRCWQDGRSLTMPEAVDLAVAELAHIA